jgi:hypothetical protein
MNLEPGATLTSMTRGMILVFGANVEKIGDLKFTVKTDSPYLDIASPGIAKANDMKEAALAYIILLAEAIKDKLPEMITQATELASSSQGVVDSAQSEIDALEGMEKLRSAACAAKMIKGLSTLPGEIKDFAARLQDEVKNLKELLEEMKDISKLQPLIDKAKSVKPSTGRDAYRCVFGGVYYTDGEYAAWKQYIEKEKIKINEADYKKWLTKEPKPKP